MWRSTAPIRMMIGCWSNAGDGICRTSPTRSFSSNNARSSSGDDDALVRLHPMGLVVVHVQPVLRRHCGHFRPATADNIRPCHDLDRHSTSSTYSLGHLGLPARTLRIYSLHILRTPRVELCVRGRVLDAIDLPFVHCRPAVLRDPLADDLDTLAQIGLSDVAAAS